MCVPDQQRNLASLFAFSAFHILPLCRFVTSLRICGNMRNDSGHVVWRFDQSASLRIFDSAFYFPHSAIPHFTHNRLTMHDMILMPCSTVALGPVGLYRVSLFQIQPELDLARFRNSNLAGSGFRKKLFSDHRTLRLIKLMASAMLQLLKRGNTVQCFIVKLLCHWFPVFDEICGVAMNYVVFIRVTMIKIANTRIHYLTGRLH